MFLHWLNGTHPEAEAIYLHHIEQRVGAQKPIDGYLPAARELFENMKAHGFNPAHPMPVNRDWSLLEGAHRTACASALKVTSYVTLIDTDHTWPEWGEQWFKDHMTNELPAILAAYGELTDA